MELRLRRRQPGESLAHLHHDVRRLMALAHPTLRRKDREAVAVDYFVDALDDSEFGLKVRERAPSTHDDALRVAQQLEAWTLAMRRQQASAEISSSKVKARRTVGADCDARIDDIVAEVTSRVTGKISKAPKPSDSVGGKGTFPASKRTEGCNKGARGVSVNERQPPYIVCWQCGEIGHIRKRCPGPIPAPAKVDNKGSQITQPIRALETQTVASPTTVHAPISKDGTGTMRGIPNFVREPVYAPLTLDGKDYPTLLDTGCELSLVPHQRHQRFSNESKGIHVALCG